MQFNSYIFILAFVPVLIIAYFGLSRIHAFWGKLCLIVGSIIFYMYGGVNIALILAISIIINYTLAQIIHRLKQVSKAVLVITIIANVAVLFYYKYFNFFLTSFNSAFETDYALRNIILPLGISFFTFQQIMYVINVYRKNIEDLNIVDYLAYILYFPKLLMGPLTEPKDLIAQLNNPSLKRINWDNLSYGIKIFCFGLFKKVILADTFAAAVIWGYGNIGTTTSMDWFLITLFYTFQIYFDFSGYTDMAIGVSTMLNIQLPMNFDSPYKALSVRDFWKRWHMSLTGFFTKYVYIPLGGSKKGNARTYINTMIVFIVSGIWHGANWTFVLWGVLHGALSVFERIFDKTTKKLMDAVRWMVTFFIINILWLLFSAESISQWISILKKMFSFKDMAVSNGLIDAFVLPETAFIFDTLHLGYFDTNIRGFGMVVFVIAAFIICLVPQNNYRKLKTNNVLTLIMAAVAFIWAFVCLSSESIFVYNNF